MRKYFLFDILSSFTKEDLRKFEDFICSSYINKKPTSIKLFNALKSHNQDLTEKYFDEKNIWKSLYPQKKFNHGVYKNQIADLTALTEEFIELENLKCKKVEKEVNLLNGLVKRRLNDVFVSKFNQSYKRISKDTLYYPEYFNDKVNLLNPLYELREQNTSIKYDFNELPFEISYYYTLNFFLNLFDNYNEIATVQYTSNYKKETNPVEDILTGFKFEKFLTEVRSKNPDHFELLNLYYFLYRAISSKDKPEDYYNFKDLLFKTDKILTGSAKRKAYITLGNSLSIISSGKIANKVNEYLQIYKKQISENIFLDENGAITPVGYSNVIKMSGFMNDYKLIQLVSKKYLGCLTGPDSVNMTEYTNAFLNFTMGNYEKALEYSMKIKLDQFMFKYDIKDLQAMIHYELKDYDSFLYLFDSYKHFLAKNKSVNPQYRLWYLKFITYIDQLFKVRESGKKFDIAELRGKLLADTFGTKFWFLERLDKMKMK